MRIKIFKLTYFTIQQKYTGLRKANSITVPLDKTSIDVVYQSNWILTKNDTYVFYIVIYIRETDCTKYILQNPT